MRNVGIKGDVACGFHASGLSRIRRVRVRAVELCGACRRGARDNE